MYSDLVFLNLGNLKMCRVQLLEFPCQLQLWELKSMHFEVIKAEKHCSRICYINYSMQPNWLFDWFLDYLLLALAVTSDTRYHYNSWLMLLLKRKIIELTFTQDLAVNSSSGIGVAYINKEPSFHNISNIVTTVRTSVKIVDEMVTYWTPWSD